MEHIEITDEFLSKYVTGMAERQMKALPVRAIPCHVFSKTFEKKMDKLIRYEKCPIYLRKIRRALRPAAAVIIFLLVVSAILVMQVDADRRAFIEMIKSIFPEGYMMVSYDKTEDFVYSPGEITVLHTLPEGFALVSETIEEDSYKAEYSVDNHVIHYICRYVDENYSHLSKRRDYCNYIELDVGTISWFESKAGIYMEGSNGKYIHVLYGDADISRFEQLYRAAATREYIKLPEEYISELPLIKESYHSQRYRCVYGEAEDTLTFDQIILTGGQNRINTEDGIVKTIYVGGKEVLAVDRAYYMLYIWHDNTYIYILSGNKNKPYLDNILEEMIRQSVY